jgi:hypothetical protein
MGIYNLFTEFLKKEKQVLNIDVPETSTELKAFRKPERREVVNETSFGPLKTLKLNKAN